MHTFYYSAFKLPGLMGGGSYYEAVPVDSELNTIDDQAP